MLVTDWPKILPMVQYSVNHRPRKMLGDRCPIEVMTGRAPDMALDLVLWTGKNLKEGTSIEAGVEQVDKYCDKLVASIDVMHTAIADAELQRQRDKGAAAANNRHAHRFQPGDLVMITVTKTSVNAVCTSKPRVRWQVPLQVTSVPEGESSHIYV